MAIKDSLSEVSASLAKILQQLKDIEDVQSRIERQASTLGNTVRSASDGTQGQQSSVGGSGFSTPPAPPGSQLGGITPTSAGGGAPTAPAPGAGGGGGGVGSMLPWWVKPVAMGVGAAVDVAYNATPSVSDAYTNQNLRFRTSFMQPGGYRSSDWDKMKALWGDKQSDPYAMVTASNVFSMSGMAMGTQSYEMGMTQASTVSSTFGISGAEAAVGQAQLYSGSQASRLAQSGIFMSDFSTGKQKSLSQIVDDIWSRAFRKGPNGKVSWEGFNTAMQRGWLGSWLSRNFQEPLYSQIYQALYLKAQNNAETLDYSQLEGAGTAFSAAEAQGLTTENAPYQTAMQVYGTQSDATAASSPGLLAGYRAGSEVVMAQNQAVTALAETPIGTGALAIKGAYQTLMSNPGTAAALGAVSGITGGVLGDVLDQLFGAGGEGGEGGQGGTGGAGGPGGGSGAGGAAVLDRLSAIHTTLLQMRDCVCGADAGDFGPGRSLGGGDFNSSGSVDKRSTSTLQAAVNALVDGLKYLRGGPIGAVLQFIMDGGWKGPLNNDNVEARYRSAGGLLSGPGSSTSDNIHALLSPGEYVVNARAAQAVGTETLNRINAMGKEFGSAFASPARNFDSGGCVDGACPGDSTLDGWTALAYGDPALTKFPVQGAPNFPNGGMWLLERSGIGEYMAAFASAWQAHPDLGGSRLDLNVGASYGHALRQSASGGGVSNHSAGVAMDLRHDEAGFPLDVNNYQARPAEKAAIQSLLSKFNKLEWGGEWDPGSIDEMHFEIRDPGTWGEGAVIPDVAAPDSATPTTEDPAVKQMQASSISGSGSRSGIGMNLGNSIQFSMQGFSGGAGSLGLGLAYSISWVSGALFGGGAGYTPGSSITASGQSSAQAQSQEQQDAGGDAASTTHPDPGDGSGGKWLYEFLVSKGLRGDQLKTVWVIGSRESGGNPNLVAAMDRGNFTYPDVPGDFNGSSESWRGGRYDVGLFQINSQHLTKVQSMFGGDMLTMIDPNKNFEMLKSLSGGLSNWTPWGIAGSSGDGFSYIDWSTWGGSWGSTWGPKTEARDAEFLREYESVNVHGYSEGAYRTHNEMAQLHEGEMVLPAAVAEQFRQIMREAAVPGSRSGDVTINLKIDKASDEEAERFARRVQKILKEDDWMSSMRSR